MRLDVALRAQREIERLGRRWLEFRDKAPHLFEEELANAYALIKVDPGLGQKYSTRHERVIQRLLMPKTRHHVYYCQVEPELIRVMSVWSAVRERGPTL